MSEYIVRAFQAVSGLKVDGVVGKRTLAAADAILKGRGADTSIPRNRRALEANAAYGKPSWTRGNGRSVDLDDAWEAQNIRTFVLHTGQRRRLHRLVGDEFVRLFEEACKASGYTPASVQTYNPRVIGGTERLSLHAYGLAFDVDPQLNPWGGRPDAPLRQHPEFVAVFEAEGWTWGGRWKDGKGDDMHFQRCGI